MSIKSFKNLGKSMAIVITWIFISLGGVVIVGFIAIAMFNNLSGGQEEKVFIFMINDWFNPWLGGILLAAIFSAIMSTIDSQLLVSSSALSEDFYCKAIRKEASEKEIVWIGRGRVIVISIIGLIMVLDRDKTIFGIVAYTWGGFGAAFGPLVLFSLYSKKTSWQSALAGKAYAANWNPFVFSLSLPIAAWLVGLVSCCLKLCTTRPYESYPDSVCPATRDLHWVD